MFNLSLNKLIVPSWVAALILSPTDSSALTFDIFDPYVDVVPLSTKENFPSKYGGSNVSIYVPPRGNLGLNSKTIIYEAPEITIIPKSVTLAIDFGFAQSVEVSGRLFTSASVINHGNLTPAFGPELLKIDGTYIRPPGPQGSCGSFFISTCVDTFDLPAVTNDPEFPGLNKLDKAILTEWGNDLYFRGKPVITDFSSAEGRRFSIGFEVTDAAVTGVDQFGNRVSSIPALLINADVVYTQRFTQARLETNLAQAERADQYQQWADDAAKLSKLLNFSTLIKRGALNDPSLINSVRDFVREPALQETLNIIDAGANRDGARELLANQLDTALSAATFIVGKSSPTERVSFLAQTYANYYATLAYVTERLAEDPPRNDYSLVETEDEVSLIDKIEGLSVFQQEGLLLDIDKEGLISGALAFDKLFSSLMSYERYQGALIDQSWSIADQQYFAALGSYESALDYLDLFNPLDSITADINNLTDWFEVRKILYDSLSDGTTQVELQELIAILSLDGLDKDLGNGLITFDFEVDRLFGTNLVTTYRNSDDPSKVPLPNSAILMISSFLFVGMLKRLKKTG